MPRVASVSPCVLPGLSPARWRLLLPPCSPTSSSSSALQPGAPQAPHRPGLHMVLQGEHTSLSSGCPASAPGLRSLPCPAAHASLLVALLLLLLFVSPSDSAFSGRGGPPVAATPAPLGPHPVPPGSEQQTPSQSTD